MAGRGSHLAQSARVLPEPRPSEAVKESTAILVGRPILAASRLSAGFGAL